MSDGTITWVYCYDVSSDRNRNRIARHIEKRAVRVQKSVFEARLTRQAAEALFRALERRLDPGDSLRMYALTPSALEQCRANAGAPLPEDGAFWIV